MLRNLLLYEIYINLLLKEGFVVMEFLVDLVLFLFLVNFCK